ncbi:LacI family DNA-binding transcriptional regulator [Salinicoccus hispanicus]|uniref:LacI family DNA-binding transcriptional regulator n=1 Tax=Salinicoccus hispanicus TaxID=157225 RepID=A0A6N8TZF0_9STAP|nr:LacI family DNA-binding transcriptional regulator [Salinicoccus hispanicus]MXQ51388.1 LacI family DNA-binding transcriptional regulator [Salinicoccus hispanicus]
MEKITIKDVAKHANISASTVSQYLNGRYNYMSEATRQRIEESIKLLGYHPNYMARNLKNRTTKTIGIIVSNILHHFAVTLTREIENYCDRDGYNLIICNADDDPDKEQKYIDGLLEKQVDGLIIMPTTENTMLYQQLEKRGFPVVFVDRNISTVGIPSFKLDNHQAIEQAISYLSEKNVRMYQYVGVSDAMNLTPRVERMEAFNSIIGEEVEKKTITAPTNDLYDTIVAEFDIVRGCGVVIANDFALMTFLKYVDTHNIDLVEDIHIVSIDDIPLAEVYRPNISTIAQPIKDIAEAAYTTVMNKAEGSEYTRPEHFAGKLIRR